MWHAGDSQFHLIDRMCQTEASDFNYFRRVIHKTQLSPKHPYKLYKQKKYSMTYGVVLLHKVYLQYDTSAKQGFWWYRYTVLKLRQMVTSLNIIWKINQYTNRNITIACHIVVVDQHIINLRLVRIWFRPPLQWLTFST